MKLLAIDGNSLLNRAFYAVKGLTSSKGFPTNAIYGFCGILEKMLKEDEFSHVVVAFDLKAPTFRHKQFKDYKKNRKKMPNELFLQLEETKKMLNLLGIYVCGVEGFEADDVLGSLSRIFYDNDIKTVIATGDRDCFQLINDRVVVRLSSNKEAIFYDEDKIFEKYGLTPKDLIEVKALMGDASDNIPGVRGIGEKTAIKLISQYKTVEKIYDNLDDLDVSNRVKMLLKQSGAKELCFKSKKLGTICLTAPINENVDEYLRKDVKKDELISFLKELELNKILNIFLEKYNITPDCSEKKYISNNVKIIKNPDISYVLSNLKLAENLDFYVDEDQEEEKLYLFGKDIIFEFDEKSKKDVFVNVILKSSKKKRTTNLKKILTWCYEENLKFDDFVFSCDIAAYLVDVLEENFNVKNIANRFLGDCYLPYCFSKLADCLEKKIKELNLTFLFEKVEILLVKVLVEMEMEGIYINKEELIRFGDFLQKEIDEIKEEIFKDCGAVFNVNSTKELGFILFEKLSLKKGKKTKTGYSTDNSVLEKLLKHHPVISKIMDYRVKSKLMTTYVRGIADLVDSNGRIHSSFNQTKTKTGRISSKDPNMQNIPVKTELGSKIRKFFTAREGSVLIDADYSQIELRVLAFLAKDLKMIEIFKNGGDIHSLTAKQIFGFVNEETRRKAKTINFAVIYGVSAFSLSKDIGVSVLKAKEYIESFFEGYFGVKKYFENVISDAKKNGYVKTHFGRIRPILELNSKSKKIIEFGERIAKNTPIQGTAADIMKIAMVKIFNSLKKENLQAKIILQVHDEILVEVSKKDCEKAQEIIKKNMQNAVSFNVPLICHLGVGKTWFDAKS